MNLANLGKAGLLVAQNRLQTTGHNINNAATAGYNRQTVLSETAGATPTGSGWIGRGVLAVGIQRSYDNFLHTQLSNSITRGAALKTYGDQISQINNLIADRTVGISPGIQKFFDSLEALATAPADVAARQELLGRANSLASQIRDANAFIDSQRTNINTQISTTVEQINSHLDRIHDLNRQITTAKASNPGQPPNDLLDQRDQLVSGLGELIDFKVYEQDDRVSLTIGNGQTVLAGDTVFHLQVHPSKADPSRMALNYTATGADGTLQPIEMSDDLITGGKLGGLLSFRHEALDTVQNDLGRIALGISMSVNAQHAQGYDPSGDKGGYFFSSNSLVAARTSPDSNNTSGFMPAISASPGKIANQSYQIEFDGANNVFQITRVPESASGIAVAPGASVIFDGVEFDFTGLAAPNPADTYVWDVKLAEQPLAKVIGHLDNSPAAGSPVASVADLSRLGNLDYRLRYDAGAGHYTVASLPSGQVFPTTIAPGGKAVFDGIEIDTAGMSPLDGDSWLIQPGRGAAADLYVQLSDPSKIAAAGYNTGANSPAGSANGDNALKLAALRTGKVLANGTMGLNEAYSQLVNTVAVKTQANTTAQKAQDTLIQQNFAAQQAVSGVNLDEEYINLQQYQEQYRAAARLIDAASTLFDTLLSLRG